MLIVCGIVQVLPLLVKGTAPKIILTSTEVDFPRDKEKGESTQLRTFETTISQKNPLDDRGDFASVLISSSLFRAALVIGGAYYVSQFGFRASGMLTKLLARELYSRNIQVNTIDPVSINVLILCKGNH